MSLILALPETSLPNIRAPSCRLLQIHELDSGLTGRRLDTGAAMSRHSSRVHRVNGSMVESLGAVKMVEHSTATAPMTANMDPDGVEQVLVSACESTSFRTGVIAWLHHRP